MCEWISWVTVVHMENIPVPEGLGSLVCSEVAMVEQERELPENATQVLFILYTDFWKDKTRRWGEGNWNNPQITQIKQLLSLHADLSYRQIDISGSAWSVPSGTRSDLAGTRLWVWWGRMVEPGILRDPQRRFEIQHNSTGISRASFPVEQITAPKISLPVIISHISNQTLIYWITAHGQQLWNILCNRKYLENWKFPIAQIRDWSGRAFQLPRSTTTCWGWVMVTQLDRAWQGQQWTCHGNSVGTDGGNKDSEGKKKSAFSFFSFLIKIMR